MPVEHCDDCTYHESGSYKLELCKKHQEGLIEALKENEREAIKAVEEMRKPKRFPGCTCCPIHGR